MLYQPFPFITQLATCPVLVPARFFLEKQFAGKSKSCQVNSEQPRFEQMTLNNIPIASTRSTLDW